MRSTRDTQMQEMSQLKTKLKDQNAKLLALSQEKIKMEARNKINTQVRDFFFNSCSLPLLNKILF